ncbi:MAG TPA: hypothetical protein DCY13_05115, partial [Verrucomicrobiales bacterium]|nr:hypothetical protein [Verrucomicrobiales bacterium]
MNTRSQPLTLAALLALPLLAGCSKDSAVEGEASHDSELRPITEDGVLARTSPPDYQRRPRQSPAASVQHPPMEAYLRRSSRTLQPKAIVFPDIKRTLYNASPAGANRGTEYSHFHVNSPDWLGVASDDRTVWVYTRHTLTANSYLFERTPGRQGNRLLPDQANNQSSVFGLWTLEPASGRVQYEVLPLPSVQMGAGHPMSQLAVTPSHQFMIAGNQLVRRDRRDGRFQAVPIAGSGMSLQVLDDGQLYAVSGDSILRFNIQDMSATVLASTRRNPAVHPLDRVGRYDSGMVWPGKDGSLRVGSLRDRTTVVHELSADGSKAREVVRLERVVPAPRVTAGHAMFQSGNATEAGAWLALPHDSDNLEIAMVHGVELMLHLPHLLAQDGNIMARWFAPPGLQAAAGQITELAEGFLLLAPSAPYLAKSDIPASAFISSTRQEVLAYFDFQRAGAAVFPVSYPQLPAQVGPATSRAGEDRIVRLAAGVALLRPSETGCWFLPYSEFEEEARTLARQSPQKSRPQPMDDRSKRQLNLELMAKRVPSEPGQPRTEQELRAVMSSRASIEQNIGMIDHNGNLTVDGDEGKFIDLNRDGQIDAQETENLRFVSQLLAGRVVATADRNR